MEATLRLYRDGRTDEVPGIAAMRRSVGELDDAANALAGWLREVAPATAVDVSEGVSVPGGGALPLAELPTRLVLIGQPGAPARALAERMRRGQPPIMTRFVDDRVALDVRTLTESDLSETVSLLQSTLQNQSSSTEDPFNDKQEEPPR